MSKSILIEVIKWHVASVNYATLSATHVIHVKTVTHALSVIAASLAVKLAVSHVIVTMITVATDVIAAMDVTAVTMKGVADVNLVTRVGDVSQDVKLERDVGSAILSQKAVVVATLHVTLAMQEDTILNVAMDFATFVKLGIVDSISNTMHF